MNLDLLSDKEFFMTFPHQTLFFANLLCRYFGLPETPMKGITENTIYETAKRVADKFCIPYGYTTNLGQSSMKVQDLIRILDERDILKRNQIRQMALDVYQTLPSKEQELLDLEIPVPHRNS